jgi:hypothetical protein
MQITMDRSYSIRRMRQAGFVIVAGSLMALFIYALFIYALFLTETDHADALSLPENTRPMIMMPLPRG